jgi:hypothetical protein
MTQPFDPMIRIPTVRSDHYPLIEDERDDQKTIKPLGTDYLNVDTAVRPGRVTLAAGSSDSPRDGHGVEFDLEPLAARRLAAQVLRAVEMILPQGS